MNRLKVLTVVPLAALALSVATEATPADAAQHGKLGKQVKAKNGKKHKKNRQGHRPAKPVQDAPPPPSPEAPPADDPAAAEPETDPPPSSGGTAPRTGIPDVRVDGTMVVGTGSEPVQVIAAPQIRDSGATGDGPATDEVCEGYAEAIGQAEDQQFFQENYGTPEKAADAAAEAAALEEEGTDQGCFFIW